MSVSGAWIPSMGGEAKHVAGPGSATLTPMSSLSMGSAEGSTWERNLVTNGRLAGRAVREHLLPRTLAFSHSLLNFFPP